MDESVEFLYSKFLQSDGVSTDTRKIQRGELFFALSGPNFNGNKFAAKALEAGATFAVIDDPSFDTGERTLLVEDSLRALQELGTFHRSRFKRPVFALTGSNGKTTTKELIARVLSKKYDIHATTGNLNNQIGVPLTLLEIHPQVEIAVIEMGASKVGDIAELCSFARPTHGLITNIGRAHTETFGGIEGVLRGKSELFDYLRQHDGTAFVNEADPRLAPMVKRLEGGHPYPSRDLRRVGVQPFVSFELAGQVYPTQIVGGYNYANIAAAVAVGRYFEVADVDIADAIASYIPSDRRSEVTRKGDLEIIVDAYNANPDSMLAALEDFAGRGGEKTVVLGDMLELEHSEDEHRQLGEWLESSSIDNILLIGPLMASAAAAVMRSRHFGSVGDLMKALEGLSFSKGSILLKGSRRMALEELVHNINPDK
ncbi:MAG: UDP-N-acetylmuramoyl-tripeptide--D-alanyl-D-alanine ligase [Bacteroidota bacterium]